MANNDELIRLPTYFYNADWPWVSGLNGRYYRCEDVDSELARYQRIEAALIVLLKSRRCYANGDAEIPEEISAQFDIGLDDARQIAAALNESETT